MKDESNDIKGGPRCDKTEELLKNKLKRKRPPRYWKPLVGETVALSISESDIDNEITSIIERISVTLRLTYNLHKRKLLIAPLRYQANTLIPCATVCL